MKLLYTFLIAALFSATAFSQFSASSGGVDVCDFDAYNEEFVNCEYMAIESFFDFDFENESMALTVDGLTTYYTIYDFNEDETGNGIFNLYDNEDDSNRFILIYSVEEMIIYMIHEDVENEKSVKFYLKEQE